MIKPNYNGGSIVNLMASIEKYFGSKPKAPRLKVLPKLKTRNVVLIVIDGLGYDYLMQTNSFLKENVNEKITSVFPSTTAAAITTYGTGVSPSQHACTGWYMSLKEIGTIAAILPFVSRGGKAIDVEVKDLIPAQPIYERMKGSVHAVLPEGLAETKYTLAITGKCNRHGYKNLNGMARHLVSLCKKKNKKFVYTYWPGFDGLCHKYGTSHKKLAEHFEELDGVIESMSIRMQGTDTTLIITADHGLIDTKKKIDLKNHPKLEECLAIPLCGEPRAAFCYVRPDMTKQFKDYVKTKLSKYCTLHKSSDLIKRGFFGPKPHPKLSSRVGDFILLAKDHVAIRDFLVMERRKYFSADHGGLSRKEMYVPLIVIET